MKEFKFRIGDLIRAVPYNEEFDSIGRIIACTYGHEGERIYTIFWLKPYRDNIEQFVPHKAEVVEEFYDRWK